MERIAIAIDVSKGYGDVVFKNESGTVLKAGGRFDDTAAGHDLLRQQITMLAERFPGCTLAAGIEASGGLERNWLKFFRQLKSCCAIEVFHLNALAVRNFSLANLRRNKTDPISAIQIADYILYSRAKSLREYEPQLEGARTAYRAIKNLIRRRAQLQTQLQSLLPVVHPDLVQFCRDGIPQWILDVILAYPTADHLARAKVKSLVKINQVTEARATRLIQDARNSVGSQFDSFTAETMIVFAEEIIHHNKKIDQLQESLKSFMKTDPAVTIIDSIKGLGLWTAILIRLEYGSIERFYSDSAAVAYAGLDPRYEKSGDTFRSLGISRAGRSEIRNALYMPTLTAIQFNPVIRKLYQHLKARGKPEKLAIVACMRKLVRIIYACWISGKAFDPEYVIKSKGPDKAKESNPAPPSTSLTAPISRKEAKKRRAATSPQRITKSSIRGHGTAHQ